MMRTLPWEYFKLVEGDDPNNITLNITIPEGMDKKKTADSSVLKFKHKLGKEKFNFSHPESNDKVLISIKKDCSLSDGVTLRSLVDKILTENKRSSMLPFLTYREDKERLSVVIEDIPSVAIREKISEKKLSAKIKCFFRTNTKDLVFYSGRSHKYIARKGAIVSRSDKSILEQLKDNCFIRGIFIDNQGNEERITRDLPEPPNLSTTSICSSVFTPSTVLPNQLHKVPDYDVEMDIEKFLIQQENQPPETNSTQSESIPLKDNFAEIEALLLCEDQPPLPINEEPQLADMSDEEDKFCNTFLLCADQPQSPINEKPQPEDMPDDKEEFWKTFLLDPDQSQALPQEPVTTCFATLFSNNHSNTTVDKDSSTTNKRKREQDDELYNVYTCSGMYST